MICNFLLLFKSLYVFAAPAVATDGINFHYRKEPYPSFLKFLKDKFQRELQENISLSKFGHPINSIQLITKGPAIICKYKSTDSEPLMLNGKIDEPILLEVEGLLYCITVCNISTHIFMTPRSIKLKYMLYSFILKEAHVLDMSSEDLLDLEEVAFALYKSGLSETYSD
jgi:hypothetical protein